MLPLYIGRVWDVVCVLYANTGVGPIMQEVVVVELCREDPI